MVAGALEQESETTASSASGIARQGTEVAGRGRRASRVVSMSLETKVL
jgi:hypothetical protein